MGADTVRELAERLQAELEQQGALDEDARAALDELREDVDRALASRQRTEPPPSSRAQSMVERFEADHPELTALVQRLADALHAIGL